MAMRNVATQANHRRSLCVTFTGLVCCLRVCRLGGFGSRRSGGSGSGACRGAFPSLLRCRRRHVADEGGHYVQRCPGLHGANSGAFAQLITNQNTCKVDGRRPYATVDRQACRDMEQGPHRLLAAGFLHLGNALVLELHLQSSPPRSLARLINR